MVNNNLVFHYQNVIHKGKDGIFLHEAFSTRLGILYSVNPLPVEVSGDTEEEVEEALRAMEADSVKYKAVKSAKISKEFERWVDEVDVNNVQVVPTYDDEEELEEDYYNESGEVLDIVDYMNRFRL